MYPIQLKVFMLAHTLVFCVIHGEAAYLLQDACILQWEACASEVEVSHCEATAAQEEGL
jgi:hypothetical protein